ncbi:MAG: DEAD/DEAH box helicase family protein, partial [Acidobacteriota bacterium]|nr:DEAD/DEAH box helicase family protein [Acidobacteriota bacterium]
MGESTPFPSSAAIKRAEQLTRERFVFEGEAPAEALAPGTARRRALDAALTDVQAGLKVPSLDWRQEYSLLLGLERVLSEEEPRLTDGTVLSAHQVDALSGTLTALLAGVDAEAAGPAGEELEGYEDVVAGEDEGPVGHEDLQPVGDEDLESEDDEDLEPEDIGDDDAVEDDDAADDDEADDEDEAEAEDDEAEDDEEPSEDEEPQDWQHDDAGLDEDISPYGAEDDPGADRRFWFEHATGAGKTVAAVGFVEASRTGGVLILTHRRNLVDQFIGELKDRGYRDRLCKPLLIGEDAANGPVTVETYQWFVRNAGKISGAYTIVICDEAHTALGEKTSAAIRAWTGPIFIGMTATGALIARHVTDL